MFNIFKKFISPSSTKPKTETKGTHYYNLKVLRINPETKDAITIEFEHPSAGKLNYRAGQFLTLITTIDGKEVRRAYSLCSSPETEPNLTVAVKRVENGLMSNWLPNNLSVGQLLKVMEPMGNFTIDFNKTKKRHLILFAGGSGITPMISIIKSLLANEPQSIASLVYCNRNEDSIIFKDSLFELESKHKGRLNVIHILDEASPSWKGLSGLLKLEILEKLMKQIPSLGTENTTYLICGPEGMMKNVEQLLDKLQIPKDNIIKESFINTKLESEKKRELQDSPERKPHEVKIIYNGAEYQFLVPANKYILETALSLGIDLPFSCQSGLCTACRGKALSGKVHIDDSDGLSQSELDEGYVLTCVGHPISDDVVIEIG